MVLIDMLFAVNDINVVYGLFYKGACSLFIFYFYVYFMGIRVLFSLYLTFLLLNLFTHMYFLCFNPQYSKRITKHNCGTCQMLYEQTT